MNVKQKQNKILLSFLSIGFVILLAGCVSTTGSPVDISASSAKNSIADHKISEIIASLSWNDFKLTKPGNDLRTLPDGEGWLIHLKEDLLPFWTMDSALGDPPGNFPTYRSNTGALVDYKNQPEGKTPPPEIKKLIVPNRVYVRAQARQTYAYCLAYHMTGEEKYLLLAKTGVDYLRANAMDRENGGTYSYYNTTTNQWEPGMEKRTSQDMAYALSGIGLYYYLTRDPDLLDDILFIKNHIFDTYYDPQLDLLRWVLKGSEAGIDDPDEYSPKQKELVSQLDQVYGYMLWLTPSMPEDIRKKWTEDLEHLAFIMIEQFFSTEYHFFWGQITDVEHRYVGAPHTDFGHSIKTMWLIHRIGLYTNNIALVEFARENATRLINIAYIKETNSWARCFDEKGNLDDDKEWWSLAELDQTTATLGLTDPSLLRYLPNTYKYWVTYMVDHENHEVWHMVKSSDNKPDKTFPKVHAWKTCFHSFEHAFIAYMTTQEVKKQPITLYYAFKNKEDSQKYIHPYFYFGKYNENDVTFDTFNELTDYNKVTVKITNIR